MTTATDLLNDLVAAGVTLRIAPDDPEVLEVDGLAQDLTPRRLDLLRAHKSELLHELSARSTVNDMPEAASPRQHRVVGADSLPMEWRAEWEERSAIMQYDGGLTRDQAEAEALADILRQMRAEAEMLVRHYLDIINGIESMPDDCGISSADFQRHRYAWLRIKDFTEAGLISDARIDELRAELKEPISKPRSESD